MPKKKNSDELVTIMILFSNGNVYDVYSNIRDIRETYIKRRKFYEQYCNLFNKFNSRTVNNSLRCPLHHCRRCIADIYNRICAQLFCFCYHSLCGNGSCFVHHFVVGYQFLDCFGLNVGLGIVDAWSYDNGTNTSGDEFTNPNAHIHFLQRVSH